MPLLYLVQMMISNPPAMQEIYTLVRRRTNDSIRDQRSHIREISLQIRYLQEE
jgi:hypothetical protein